MASGVWPCGKNWKRIFGNKRELLTWKWRLIISLGGSASDSSDSSDTEAEDDVVSDDQLSGIEDLAWNSIKR
jgi:hypothetical protein